MGPLNDLLNLWLSSLDGGLDEDTEDELQVVSLGSRTHVLKGVAVSAVQAENLEALGSDVGKVACNFISRLAGAGGAIRSVSKTPLLASSAAQRAGRVGGWSWGWSWRRSRSRSRSRGGGGGRSWCRCGSAGWESLSRGGEWADIDVFGLGDGGGDLGGSVSTSGVRGWSWVDHDGGGGDGGGDGCNGVGTSGWAHIGGGQDGAGDDASGGRDGGIWADHGGGGLDHGGDTSNGVGSGWHGGGGSGADGGGLGQGDGGGREGVDTRGVAGGH